MKKNNLRIKGLNIGIVITVLLAILGILSRGSTYYLQTNYYPENADKITNYTVAYSDNSVVKCTDAYISQDSEIIFVFEALDRGKTNVDIHLSTGYPNGERSEWNYHSELEVWFFDLILDRNLGSFSGYDIAIYAIVFMLLLTIIITAWEFVECRMRGDFSHLMIACGSVAIFTFVLLLFTLYKLLNNVVKTFHDFVRIVSDIGYYTLILLFIPMLLMSGFLIISNIWLIRHEGKRPINGLGIFFGILWMSGTIIALNPFDILSPLNLPSFVSRSAVYILCYFECLFISTVICSYLAVKYHTPYDRDYIIILGCGIRKDGTLTPLLRGRVDSALTFEKKQFKSTGKHAVFVPSGGQGPDEVISESEAMTRYLTDKNIPSEQILNEDKSTSTYENLLFSKKVIESQCENIKKKKIAFSTTNYHVLRGYILSAKIGYHAKGISSPTKTYFFPNAYIREFIGLLVDQWYVHLVNGVGIVGFFLLLNQLS